MSITFGLPGWWVQAWCVGPRCHYQPHRRNVRLMKTTRIIMSGVWLLSLEGNVVNINDSTTHPRFRQRRWYHYHYYVINASLHYHYYIITTPLRRHTSNGIDLVKEDDACLLAACQLKQLTDHTGSLHTNPCKRWLILSLTWCTIDKKVADHYNGISCI